MWKVKVGVSLLLLAGCLGPEKLLKMGREVDQMSEVSLRRCTSRETCQKEMPCLVTAKQASLKIQEANGRFKSATRFVTGALAWAVTKWVDQSRHACEDWK